MNAFWKAAIGVAGLGAIGAFVFYSLYTDFIKLPIFEKLSAGQTFALMIMFLLLVFCSLIAMLIAWLKSRKLAPGETGPTTFTPPSGASFKEVIDGLAQANKRVAVFHGFTAAELALIVRSVEIASESPEGSLRNVGQLTSPQLVYTVEKQDGRYEISKRI